jgi:shikimate kinase
VSRHLVLVGLSGSGKSTVGRLVAGRLGAPFADLDRLLEARAGRAIPRLFAEEGEAAFRRLETLVGAEALEAQVPTVIATGGGFMVDPSNRARARTHGYVVYLQTSPGTAAARVGTSSGRPLLEGASPVQKLGELLARREEGYLEAAARVTTDGRAAEAVADEVVKLARTEGGW